MGSISHNVNFLKQLIEFQIKVVEMLEHGIDEEYNDNSILSYFKKVQNEMLLANTSISRKCADYFQLLKEPENFEGVELSDIEKLYSLFIKTHPLDISLYEDFAFYLSNVQDKPIEAKQILNSGIEIIEARLSELKITIKNLD